MEDNDGKKTSEEAARDAEAEGIVKRYALGGAGVGLIPVPLVDLLGLVGVQLAMARRLAALYEVPFQGNLARSLIASLVGFGAAAAVHPLVASLIKIVPVVGQVSGIASGSAVGGATTWAVGKVLIRHFAAGGTFLTLDPEAARAYYAEQLEAGKQQVPLKEERKKP